MFNSQKIIMKHGLNHLKKLLKKYRASNCTFSLAGDECSLSYFRTTELQKRKVIIQQPKR
jgi:hypothetical protein